MPRKLFGKPPQGPISGIGCEGRGVAYSFNRFPDAHAKGVVDWGSCWKCGGSLGCSTCTTTNALEVCCRACATWGTKAAFLHHGPIVPSDKVRRPAAFEEYPTPWRAEYEAPAPYEPKTIKDILSLIAPKEIP